MPTSSDFLPVSTPLIDLAGTWHLRMDPDDQGGSEAWYAEEWITPKNVQLPGSLQEQGFGEKPTLESTWVGSIIDQSYFTEPEYEPYRQPDNIKYPCWLQPERMYQGPAWYRRKMVLPETWTGKSWILHLERCHWTTRLWINGEEIGFRESLSVAHEYEIPAGFSGEIELTLCVDNRIWIDVGPNSHSISDHTQTNWNGVVGALEARLASTTRISGLEIHPNVTDHKVCIKGHLSCSAHDEDLQLTISKAETIGTGEVVREETLLVEGGFQTPFTWELDLGHEVALWSPGDPNLYELSIKTADGTALISERFGMVEVDIHDTQFTLNHRPLFLRGALDCAIFPLTGYPSMKVEEWKEIFQTCKAYGLNHIRFHSWCPPKAAFVAGDEVGILFQVECPSWANTTASVGNGDPLDKWLYVEAERILEAYGNHACFRFMAYGNEPAGPAKDSEEEYPGLQHGAKYLGPWCEHWRKKDPRRLHAAGAGWPRVRESDFHNVPDPRVQRWGEGLDSIINAQPPCSNYTHADKLVYDKPTVSHEIGQWCAFPDLEEIGKYTGVLKAKNFEIFADFLEQVGLRHQADDFLTASGKLQAFCYKADIEAALRTPGFAGFQLLGLQDFPGQGTALVGVLNAFWKSKGYCEAERFREWCNDIVLLAEFPKHLYVEGETLEVPILLANFGLENLTAETVHWCLQDETGEIHASGTLSIPSEAADGRTSLGTVSCTFPEGTSSLAFEFVLSLHERKIQNRWSVFSFPPPAPLPVSESYAVITEWNPDAEATLEHGGTVWLRLEPKDMEVTVPFGFSSIFWNTAWSRKQPPHTLGVLCDPDHPALKDFPAGPYSDWQWWGVCTYGEVMNLDGLPADLQPIIQIVPDWFAPHKLAVAFEAKVGNGRLLVTSIDFTTAPEEDPGRVQLANSFSTYLTSPDFQPPVRLTEEELKRTLG